MSTQLIGDRRAFEPLAGGGYVLKLVDEGVRVEIRHLRRERFQLIGEMDVMCNWHGVLARDVVDRVDDETKDMHTISCADLNLSSQYHRDQRGKYCAARAKTKPEDFDWPGVIDEACRRVIQSERDGTQAIVLDDAPSEGPPADLQVHGLSIPTDSHSQLVCDGGGLKSMLLLLVLGTMALCGMPVLYCDWEWNAPRHLARKRRLFGPDRLDHLHYLRCRNSLNVEKDHIRRFCDAHAIQFIGIDSVGAACDGKLADDDVARAYNHALDGLPPSLAAAHVPKNGNGDPAADLKAFGSAFFHNYARMTWTVKKQASDDNTVAVLLVPYKQNDGDRHKPVALEFAFSPEAIRVRGVEPTSVDAFTATLPVWQRMKTALSHGPRTLASLSEEVGAKVETLEREVRRKNGLFTRVPGQDGITRVALVERQTA